MNIGLKILLAGFAGGLTGIVITKIYWGIMISLVNKIAELGSEAYLNGFKIVDWRKNLVFPRMSHYVGHGLCYEASALLVLLLKDHSKTRLVYANAYSWRQKERLAHCFIEVKAYGFWWVLDSTWGYHLPIPRPLYYLKRLAVLKRKISDEEFFTHPIAREMAETIKNPKTSYIFHDLCLFRQAYWINDTDIVLENEGISSLSTGGEYPNLLLIDAFSEKHPVTQRVIREFMLNDRRYLPKRRTIRKARVLTNTVKCMVRDATALHEKTGNTIDVKLTSIKTFTLTECTPSA